VMADVALPVDLRTVKQVLKPAYDRLMREGEIAPLMGEKATAARALDRLMKSPDHASLSAVDGALGELKTFARADNPDLRSIGQGVVLGAVKQLDAQVKATAAKAGPSVLKALEDGRKATIGKYAAADVLKGLETGQGEAVAAFRRLTAPGDSAIAQLRDVAKQAPAVKPQLARAVLDQLIGDATAGGGFEHAARLETTWSKYGPETKALLFEKAHVADLDNFFRLARKLAENPNPSGTAKVNNLFNAASTVVGYPVAKLLYSPAGVKLLTQGFVIPLRSPTVAASYSARLTSALKQAAAREPVLAQENRNESDAAAIR